MPRKTSYAKLHGKPLSLPVALSVTSHWSFTRHSESSRTGLSKAVTEAKQKIPVVWQTVEETDHLLFGEGVKKWG